MHGHTCQSSEATIPSEVTIRFKMYSPFTYGVLFRTPACVKLVHSEEFGKFSAADEAGCVFETGNCRKKNKFPNIANLIKHVNVGSVIMGTEP